MPKANIETDPGPDDSVSTPNGPGQGPMSPEWIVIVAIYLVVVSILVLYGLIKLWPYPTPSGETSNKTEAQADTSRTGTNAAGAAVTSPQTGSATPAPQTAASSNTPGSAGAASSGAAAGTSSQNPAATTSQVAPAAPAKTTASPPKKELPDPEVISFFGDRFKPTIYLETRLLLLVMLAGALGSLMHALRSLYWYTGNRMMVWSWVGFYLLLPFTGAMLAVIFYFVVRGGFFSPQASFENTSPFGFAALSALVGLFSPQATLKLKEIAETIFTKPGAGTDTKPQAAVPQASTAAAVKAPTITSVMLDPVSSQVTIQGSGFAQNATVKFGVLPAQVSSIADNTIVVTLPTASTPGPVDVEVKNADGGTATLPQGFTYTAGNVTAVTDADVDELDVHDVELKTDTADEQLPVTKGGVEENGI